MVRRTRQRDPELEQFWRRTIAERERSGMSVRELCVRLGVKEANFYAWRREIAKRDRVKPALAFVPIQIRADSRVEIVLDTGMTVRLPADTEATVVAQLIAALRAASC